MGRCGNCVDWNLFSNNNLSAYLKLFYEITNIRIGTRYLFSVLLNPYLVLQFLEIGPEIVGVSARVNRILIFKFFPKYFEFDFYVLLYT